MIQDEEPAELQQRYALEALAEVKEWVWRHHALPQGAAVVTAEAATRHAIYVE